MCRFRLGEIVLAPFRFLSLAALLLALAPMILRQACCPKDAPGTWTAWFAWRPVLAGGRLLWLRRVERRAVCNADMISFRVWQYRAPS